MALLSDTMLLESYYKAVELQLDKEFIQILFNEIDRRKLPVILS
ncbi:MULTISPECIES: sporulation histidine kinase inhibitor Sda [unclassified Paenibacillus]|nr:MULTISPECIES: sporulation histidine kinase inhibitor Sda [unclassified Paenibacillus]MBU5441475.1 sporulation histidine kinase inhibitor Sda [Paenibacillus sp. MSJ-34]CAH0118345.1 Sporulation inhibitor sda [Paenibacillus sp. CECT 9249]